MFQFIRSMFSRRKVNPADPARQEEKRREAPRLPEIKQIIQTPHVRAARSVPLDWHQQERQRVLREEREREQVKKTTAVYKGDDRRKKDTTRHPEEDRFFRAQRSLDIVPSSADPFPMPIEFDSSRMTSPVSDAFEGKGGGFDGGGASGDWTPSASPSYDSGSSDCGSSSDSGSSCGSSD